MSTAVSVGNTPIRGNGLRESVLRGNTQPKREQKVDSIWTHQQFNWAWKNPCANVFTTKNDYVAEQWSEEFFTSSKNNMTLAKTSLKAAWKELTSAWEELTSANWKETGSHLATMGGHLLNALLILIKLGINVELGNFLKGAIGTFISTGKFLYHTGAAAGELFLVLVFTLFGSLGCFLIKEYRMDYKELLQELGNSCKNMGKDITSLITCVGHAIPSWLPLVVTAMCPPAGAALFLLKNADKFTGIFDVLGYGGTALLLWSKTVTVWGEPTQETIHAKTAWEKMKKDLNPCKTSEGALLGMYFVHVIVEGATTIAGAALSHFVPGADTVMKYMKEGGYALQGFVALGLATSVYRNSQSEEEMQNRTPAEQRTQDRTLAEQRTQEWLDNLQQVHQKFAGTASS